jgi:ABC-2 type transport system ATP-binding protein
MGAAIRLENVHRAFGKNRALDGLTLQVNEGEIYGFLGRNGAGKTTTLRILMGILRADSGTLELLGERLKRITVRHKQRIGYVSQEPSFYPWMTARELGRFVGGLFPTWDGAELERLLRLFDVAPDTRAAELSGGTRAKLGLALALAPRPPLLLLDEPTAGLDPVARREFNDLLLSLHKERGTTVFFSSHLVGEVEQISQRVGIIQKGRARFEGDVKSLLASVRRVVATAPVAMPPHFELLRADVYRAPPEAWEQTPWPEGVSVHMLSLEDAFLAFARVDGSPS